LVWRCSLDGRSRTSTGAIPGEGERASLAGPLDSRIAAHGVDHRVKSRAVFVRRAHVGTIQGGRSGEAQRSWKGHSRSGASWGNVAPWRDKGWWVRKMRTVGGQSGRPQFSETRVGRCVSPEKAKPLHRVRPWLARGCFYVRAREQARDELIIYCRYSNGQFEHPGTS
jgi:hypothetical protein